MSTTRRGVGAPGERLHVRSHEAAKSLSYGFYCRNYLSTVRGCIYRCELQTAGNTIHKTTGRPKRAGY